MASRDQELFDEFLSQALDILRLGVAQKNVVLARLAKLEKELIGKLSEADISALKKRDVNRLIADLNETVAKTYTDVATSPDLPGVAAYAASETQEALSVFYLGKAAIAMPSAAYLESVASNVLIQGAPSAAWWKAQADDTAFKFASQVRLGLVAGETNQQIIARIVGKSGQPGVMDTVRRNAASLVQTSVQTVANDARRTTFKTNDDVVKGVRQVSTLDSHTTPICMAYSGAAWDMSYKPIAPNNLPFKGGCPRHFNCRSLEVPITKTFKEMGLDIPEAPTSTRASDEGQIAADTSFDAFLKGKSKAYLDNKLGPGRAELFRAGKITLRDLVNGEGNPVSLEQLKELARKRRSR